MNQPDPKPTGRAMTMREIREALGHKTSTEPASSSGRAAEAELYVLLRKAGQAPHEAQALIDRHRDEVLRRLAGEQPAPECGPECSEQPTTREALLREGAIARCDRALAGTVHPPHDWEPDPGEGLWHCPGDEPFAI